LRRIILLTCCFLVCSPARGQDRPESRLAVPSADSALAAQLNGWISIVTFPEGADVYRGKVFLGKTPLQRLATVEGKQILRLFYPSDVSWNAVAMSETLSVRRGEETKITLNFADSHTLGIVQPELLSPDKIPDLYLNTSDQEQRKLWIGYAAGTAMILSGITAAYLKDQANKDFDSYVQTRDPGALASTQSLDRQAGIALTITEVSLGVLLYLFLSE
jgi:hypothetical protein